MGRRRKGGPPRGTGPARADVRLDRWLKGTFDAHRAGNLHEAEKLARRVLDAVPEQPDALHLLATVARESGRTDLAVDLYRRLLRRHPAIPIAHNSLGNLLQEHDRWQEAIVCYKAAVAHDPRYASAYFNLGRALLHVNDLVRAEHCLRQAALAPGDAKAALNLAKSKRFAGQPDEDEDRIRAVAEHGAEDDAAQRDLHLALGKIDDDRGEWESAFAHYERANRPHAAAAADPTPVFVVGMPRSGTSLVEQCLAAQSAVHGAGEAVPGEFVHARG